MVEPHGLPPPPSTPSFFSSETPATGAVVPTAPFVGNESPLLVATASVAAAAVAATTSVAAVTGLDEDCFLEGAALEHLSP